MSKTGILSVCDIAGKSRLCPCIIVRQLMLTRSRCHWPWWDKQPEKNFSHHIHTYLPCYRCWNAVIATEDLAYRRRLSATTSSHFPHKATSTCGTKPTVVAWQLSFFFTSNPTHSRIRLRLQVVVILDQHPSHSLFSCSNWQKVRLQRQSHGVRCAEKPPFPTAPAPM